MKNFLYGIFGIGVFILLIFFSVDFSGIESTSSNNSETQEFHGDPCTEDCSGHEAGYNWASEKGITDPDECSGNSESFIEGCKSYAEGN